MGIAKLVTSSVLLWFILHCDKMLSYNLDGGRFDPPPPKKKFSDSKCM